MSEKLVETQVIDLDLIDPDPGQPRKEKPIEYLRELGESIKNKGLRNAIHLRENPEIDGRFWIINGECRYTASVLVGLKSIEAKVYEYSGENAEAEIFVDQIMDNVVRKDMEPLETLQAYQKALDMGMTLDDLSKAFGKSASLIEADLPILRLPEIMLKAFNRGDIPKAVARKLASLKKSQMAKAWEWARRGKDSKGMIAKIDAYVGKNSQLDLWDEEVKTADSQTKKDAKVQWGKLKRSIQSFAESKFANGSGKALIVFNSRDLNEIELISKEMAKISEKILGEVREYKARSKSSVA